MALVDPATLPMICGYCLCEATDPEFPAHCPDSEKGQHRLFKPELWAGLVVTDFFNMRSERSAMQCLGEGCWQPHDYQTARRLSQDEVLALLSGKARLRICLEKMPP